MIFFNFYTFMSTLFLLLGVLLSVAFLVLLERKILSYVQIRKGPNKVSMMGLFQSFADAIKLLTKMFFFPPSKSNTFVYFLAPIVFMGISLTFWLTFPKSSSDNNLSLSVLFFFCCSSLTVYCLIGMGWSSMSNLSLMGGVRSIAQTVSYEVSMIFIMLIMYFLTLKVNFLEHGFYNKNNNFLFIFYPMLIIWILSIFMETNRTPYDFSEGESELVSGFNTEYGSGGFVLIFLSEYSSIIFMSWITIYIFTSTPYKFLASLFSLLLLATFILIRATLPRHRYDKMMILCWKMSLVATMLLLVYYSMIFYPS